MSSLPEYITLRLRYPGNPRIAFIDGLNERSTLDRRWIADWYLRERRERHPDGTQVAVYHLPIMDAMYEVQETVGGQRRVRYVGSIEGDGNLYRLFRDEVEGIAEGQFTVRDVINKHGMSRRLPSHEEKSDA